MIEADREVFTREFVRMCAATRRAFDAVECAAFFEYLEPFPVEAVVAALPEAVRRAGRYAVTVSLIAELVAEQRGAGRGQQASERRDCELCGGTRWVARVTATGALLSELELQAWEVRLRPKGPREDGRPHVVRVRCSACRAVAA